MFDIVLNVLIVHFNSKYFTNMLSNVFNLPIELPKTPKISTQIKILNFWAVFASPWPTVRRDPGLEKKMIERIDTQSKFGKKVWKLKKGKYNAEE